jgi:hypothetical protein
MTEREIAQHLDEGKPPLALLPPAMVIGVAQVMAYGAKKYDLHNWRKGSTVNTFLGSALRHIVAYLDGENLDPESGVAHLAHAATNIGFVLQWIADGKLVDDRYRTLEKTGEAS